MPTAEKIGATIVENPNKTLTEIATILNCNPGSVSKAAAKLKLTIPKRKANGHNSSR